VPAFGASPASAADAVSSGSILAGPLQPAVVSANPPAIRELEFETVHSTRAHIETHVEDNGHKGTWRGEYATSEALLNEGKGTVAGGGELGLEDNPNTILSLGVSDEAVLPDNRKSILHHLKPGTHYYARFVVESEGSTIARTYEFTTLQVGKPEIPAVREHTENEVPEQNVLSTFRCEISPSGFSSKPTEIPCKAQVETNGLETEYHFEYTTTPGVAVSWRPFTSGASGSISVAEDFANPEATLTGLAPETTYYVRVRASNAAGEVDQTYFEAEGKEILIEAVFTTPTIKPGVGAPMVRNVTAVSAHVNLGIGTNGFETNWRYEYATSETGSWTVFASGTVSAERAAAEENSGVAATLSGLAAGQVYYVRLSAENTFGAATSLASEFKTVGAPAAVTFATHALRGEAVRVLGSVNPQTVPTSNEQTITVGEAPTGGTFTLTFEGQTTAPIAFDASSNNGPDSVHVALSALPGEPAVEGPDGGPYTVYFSGADASEPQIVADASGLTPSGTVTVQTTQQGGVAYPASYHFEYVSRAQFEKPGGEGGFAEAASTPVVGLGSGNAARTVGEDLPGLTAGETYEFRIVATNGSSVPGPIVDGEAQTLTVPVSAPSAQAACPNAALRTGPSAGLPDCRAYEQVTPVDKEGSQELFQYGAGSANGVLVGEGGDRVVLEAPVANYGSGPQAGGSPYLFSRDPVQGWQMTAASPQPETGVALTDPALFSPELTQFAFASDATTSNPNRGSGPGVAKDIEYKYGPSGGPYTSAASVPRADADLGSYNTWVGASADFSKLILQTEDHSLLGSSTGTKSGADLYEYAAGAAPRQVNVGIGVCGAEIAKGAEGNASARPSSPHAVSADGSRVFFEAVPAGGACPPPGEAEGHVLNGGHLYMRVDGVSTVDIGAYRFIGANPEGTRLVLAGGSDSGYSLYETETRVLKHLAGSEGFHAELISADGNVLYGAGPGGLSRYDVPDEKLSFVASVAIDGLTRVSPDGRYFYFNGGVAGVPSGAGQQVFRYDSAESTIECISCASSSDPEPKLESYLGSNGGAGAEDGRIATQNGVPGLTLMSANGEFAFFDTPDALVPQDIDGELKPTLENDGGGTVNSDELEEYQSKEFSPSSDVYEWREDGVDGCGDVQGCLALISSGRGGVRNTLLGSTLSGNDVFIYSQSQLAPSDTDAAGDIYDVRVNGGFPPPVGPGVECEGAACSTPASAPNDATPSSLTSAGAGNLPPAATVPSAKPKKKVVKKKKQSRKRKRVKRGHKARKTSRRGGV
jgi:hypothetical protein